ncbi:hypothetical protein [Paraburkholderia tropica]|uniref:hypothetical protein n=1 Tax=Paraburkholderia tropica TaxID=92647 RepID=UPI003D2B5A4D
MTRRIRCRTIDRSVLKPARSKDAKPKAAQPPAQDINARNQAFWAEQLGHPQVDQSSQTADSAEGHYDLNEIHRRFWAEH